MIPTSGRDTWKLWGLCGSLPRRCLTLALIALESIAEAVRGRLLIAIVFAAVLGVIGCEKPSVDVNHNHGGTQKIDVNHHHDPQVIDINIHRDKKRR